MKILERKLGLSSVVAISVSAMLGSGIFVLPGMAITVTGPSVWLAFLLAGLSVLPAAISKAELATAMPTSGGTYVYIERTFGPTIGTIAGLGLWLSLLLKSSFALIGFGAYLDILTDLPVKEISLSLLLFFVLLNIFGVGKVSNILIIIISLAITLLLGLTGIASFKLNPEFLSPFTPHGIKGLFSATALVFVSFAGVTKVAAIAEEVKEPEKNLPRGILLSLLIVTTLYCVVSFVLVSIIPYQNLAGNFRPIYLLAQTLGGETLGYFTAIISILTMSSMANSGILAASRFPFAMSRDHLLPSKFGKIHSRYLTPIWSIIISGVIVASAIIFMKGQKIAKFASVFILMIYLMENVSIIVLREARVQWYKPTYKSPLYPGLQIFGIITTFGLILSMGNMVLPAILAIGVPGVLLYVFYGRKRVKRKGVIGIRGKRQDLVEEKVEILPRQQLRTIDLSIDANVVVSLFGRERSPEMLIEMGLALAEKGNLEVAHLTEVPEQTDINDIIEIPAKLRSLRRRVVAMAIERKEPITFDTVITHDMSRTIYEISQRLHCTWLLIEWRGKGRGSFTFHSPMGWLKGHLHCNLAIFKDTGVRYIRKILVYLKNDENDQLVINTAEHFAEINHADLTLAKFVSSKTPQKTIEEMKVRLDTISKECIARAHSEVFVSLKPSEEIISNTVEFDLLIFGGSKYTLKSAFFGSEDDRLMGKAACSVISVQSINSN